MTRRTIGLLVTLALGFLVVPLPPKAQPVATMRRIGNLVSGFPLRRDCCRDSRPSCTNSGRWATSRGSTFRLNGALRSGRFDELPGLAAELVRLPVDVIVALSPQAARAAQHATATLPIVCVPRRGRCGGTGARREPRAAGPGDLGSIQRSRSGPQMAGAAERSRAPGCPCGRASGTGVVKCGGDASWRALQRTAAALGVRLRRVEAPEARRMEPAFVAMTQAQADAVIVLPHPALLPASHPPGGPGHTASAAHDLGPLSGVCPRGRAHGVWAEPTGTVPAHSFYVDKS